MMCRAYKCGRFSTFPVRVGPIVDGEFEQVPSGEILEHAAEVEGLNVSIRFLFALGRTSGAILTHSPLRRTLICSSVMIESLRWRPAVSAVLQAVAGINDRPGANRYSVRPNLKDTETQDLPLVVLTNAKYKAGSGNPLS